jgi:hypothetical protein
VIRIDAAEAALLEALIDPRIPGESVPVTPEQRAAWAELSPEAAAEALRPFTTERRIEWARTTTTQAEILAAFAKHADEELEDVTLVEQASDRLALRWRRETAHFELRAGLVGCAALASREEPRMLLADLDRADDGFVEAFAGDAAMRTGLVVQDFGRLEKIGAARASAFVHLEWFLRDAYGVKLLNSAEFTQRLIALGVISLGMG